MRWFLTGLPLVLLGGLYAYLAFRVGGVYTPFISVGILYWLAAACAASANRSLRKVAVAAWAPQLFAIPIGTALALLAIRLLLADPEDEEARRQAVRGLVPTEAAQLVRQRASIVLDVADDQMNVPLERELLVPPVELINFLRDLHIDYGLPVSGDDRKRVASVEDVVQMITARLSETREPTAASLLVPGSPASPLREAACSPYRPPLPESSS